MKSLRYILPALMMAVAALSADAQPGADRFRYGPMLGLNITDLHFKQTIVGTGRSFGPQVGLQCEFIFTSFGLGIDFGASYSMTGAKVNLGERPIWSLDGYGDERVMIHNLQLPVHLRFKWTKMQGLEDYIAPIVYGGPEFNIQIGHSRHRRDGESAFRYSGGSVGLTCGGGFEIMKHWQATFGYTWDVTYSLKTRLLEDYSARSRGWHVRVAYLF